MFSLISNQSNKLDFYLFFWRICLSCLQVFKFHRLQVLLQVRCLKLQVPFESMNLQLVTYKQNLKLANMLTCDSFRSEKQDRKSIGVGVGIGIGIEL